MGRTLNLIEGESKWLENVSFAIHHLMAPAQKALTKCMNTLMMKNTVFFAVPHPMVLALEVLTKSINMVQMGKSVFIAVQLPLVRAPIVPINNTKNDVV